MLYGSKDLMRIENIQDKAAGDFIEAIKLAVKMAGLIEIPGKAQARGYAALQVFGELSPIAYVFFLRAYDLGGDNVRAEASLNPIDDVESAYEGIPDHKLPASRRKEIKTFAGSKKISKPTPIESMARINLVKGSGPEFDIEIYSGGTIEVWQTEDAKHPRLIWTTSNEPIFTIGHKHNFSYDGKLSEWTMIDYIDTIDMGNLVPLYGKNLMIYSYT